MADWPTIPAGTGVPLVDPDTGEFISEAVNDRLSATYALPRVSPIKFGAVCDGVTNDTAAVQAAIDSLGSGGGVILLGTHRLTSELVIRQPGITLSGGTLKGRGIIAGTAVSGYIDLDLTIDGTIIDLETITTGRHGVSFAGARRVNFRGVRIFKADHAIHIEKRSLPQHTRRILFDSACAFHEGNFGMYAEQYSSLHYGIGDLHVIGMQFSAFNTTIQMAGVDGILIEGITAFQAQATARARGIDLDYITWSKISGSNLFESGTEAIRLSRFQQTQIIGNAIAWPGQLVISSAILLENGDNDGNSNSNSMISDNIIQWPTKHGVEQLAGVDSVSIVGNRIIEVGSAAKYRVGLYNAGTSDEDKAADRTARDAAMVAFGEHFGIVTPAAIRTLVNDNIVTGDDLSTANGTRFSLGHSGAKTGNQDGRGAISAYTRSVTISGTTTTIDAARGYELAQCSHSSATTITTITAAPNSGAVLRIVAFNSNTTIDHTSSVILKGAVDAAMPAAGVLTLLYSSSAWREVSRSW